MHRVTKPDQLAKTTKSGIGSYHVALDGPEGLSKKALYTMVSLCTVLNWFPII